MAFPTPLTLTATSYNQGSSVSVLPDASVTLQPILFTSSETLSFYSVDATGGSADTRPTSGLVYPRGFS